MQTQYIIDVINPLEFRKKANIYIYSINICYICPTNQAFKMYSISTVSTTGQEAPLAFSSSVIQILGIDG